MRKNDSEDKELKDEELNNESSSENNSPSQSEKDDDPYAYDEGEFNPDKWEDDASSRRRGPIMQRGLGLFVSIIALILFAALFVVEFRSYTQVKKSNNNYVSTDSKEDKVDETDSILEIIETGTNYTIYLDNDTGIEYVMFKVGSSISIQPLINPDGSYKQYVEPPAASESATGEAATKHKWTDNFKLPGAEKETTAPSVKSPSTEATVPSAGSASLPAKSQAASVASK